MVGRRLPTDKEPNPPLFQMKIFAPNTVTAKSRFWYFIRHLKNVKKAHGEIVSIAEVSSFGSQHAKSCLSTVHGLGTD